MGALTWSSLWITLGINVVLTAFFVLLYSVFSIQRINARVYFCRWFVLDDDAAKKKYENVGSAVDLNPLHYMHAFNWVWDALRLNQEELLQHAGLDMVLYLRMFVMAWKMFVPISVLACCVLIPVYVTQGPSGTAANLSNLTISNLPLKSTILWLPAVLAYLFNGWVLWVMAHEFQEAAKLRLKWVAALPDRPNQFSVLVRQVPSEVSCEVPADTDKFFSEMHPNTYLLTQACYDVKALPKLQPKLEYMKNRLRAFKIRSEAKGERPTTSKGCCGPKVDAIDLFEERVDEMEHKIGAEQERILTDPKAIVPAAVVSFNSRRGAAVAAQTLQSSDPAKWITTWAPEPEDICWTNLPIPYLQLGVRKMVIAFVTAAVVLLFTIPITIITGFLTNLSGIAELVPGFQKVLDITFLAAFLEGWLPGAALSIFLMILPPILLWLSKTEGYVAHSEIDRAAAGKHFYFKIVTVFLANVLVGVALTQIKTFVDDPSLIPTLLGSNIVSSSSFFITFTMISWVGMAGELFRGWITLAIFHIKNALLVVTPEDRVKAMSAPSPGYFAWVPEMEMFFLFTFVFMILAPFYLPFVLVFYFWAYLVFRNQFINVYSPAYDLRGGYWPHFHARAIACLIMAQVMLILVLGLRQAIGPAILCLPLPILTLMINNTFIFERYGAVFKKVPLDDATHKDKEDSQNPEYDPRRFLEGAYLQPCLKGYQVGDVEKADAARAKGAVEKAEKAAEGKVIEEKVVDESAVPLVTSEAPAPMAAPEAAPAAAQ